MFSHLAPPPSWSGMAREVLDEPPLSQASQVLDEPPLSQASQASVCSEQTSVMSEELSTFFNAMNTGDEDADTLIEARSPDGDPYFGVAVATLTGGAAPICEVLDGLAPATLPAATSPPATSPPAASPPPTLIGNTTPPATINGATSPPATSSQSALHLGGSVAADMTFPDGESDFTTEKNKTQAMVNWKDEKGTDCEWGDIVNSTEGKLYWLTKHDDFKARGALSAAFNRSVKHSKQWSDAYALMPDAMRIQFRREWSLQRTFDFTKRTRRKTSTSSKSSEDIGEHLSEASIAAALGSVSDSRCCEMAANYAAMATKMGGVFVSYSEWLKTTTYLFIKRLTAAKTSTEWQMVLEQSSETNVWEAKAKECKAIAAFAAVNQLKVDRVSLEDVVASPLGLHGWSQVVLTTNVGKGGRTPSDPPPVDPEGQGAPGKGGGGTGPGGGAGGGPKQARPPNPAVVAERNAKETLSNLQSITIDYERFTAKMTGGAGDDETQWRETFSRKLEHIKADIDKRIADQGNFVEDFRAKALSTSGMRDLKKQYSPNYTNLLITFTNTLSKPLDEMRAVLSRVYAMAAADGTTPTKRKGAPCVSGGTAKKPKAGAKASSKTDPSA
jgi:hypothetical protein